ncbi:cobalt-precorrin-6A reductase [Gluconobacter sp. Dm-62]|uniref:cobalt-precorrin-6A reductase n=1 Tax=Gluconobacter sp. Dm-62 TaxID=2799804 RepID=UPI001B8B8D64|nr:cobalt-precorrin-6A reductase [Gluconobacter sp. Dm-62]MBS1103580.1 cobalt-precorrin-6A reductase [Gluconobacter sp. Dm-62]
MRVLILGGTTEARLLMALLENRPDITAIFSLAGATKVPVLPNAQTRIGGFGGIDGLKDYLLNHDIQAVIDATHPFAATMSSNAAEACASLGLPLLRLKRPAWVPTAKDQWITVPDLHHAALALGETSRRVFLTTGRKDLTSFQASPQHHYLIRSIDAPEPASLPPSATVVLSRPPYTLASELSLMREHGTDILVTKNAGSESTKAKLDAARALGLPVIMVQRPTLPPVRTADTPQSALQWLEKLAH